MRHGLGQEDADRNPIETAVGDSFDVFPEPLEHGLSAYPEVRAWQRRLNPIERVLADWGRLDLGVEATDLGQPFERVEVGRFERGGLPRTRGKMYRGPAMK